MQSYKQNMLVAKLLSITVYCQGKHLYESWVTFKIRSFMMVNALSSPLSLLWILWTILTFLPYTLLSTSKFPAIISVSKISVMLWGFRKITHKSYFQICECPGPWGNDFNWSASIKYECNFRLERIIANIKLLYCFDPWGLDQCFDVLNWQVQTANNNHYSLKGEIGLWLPTVKSVTMLSRESLCLSTENSSSSQLKVSTFFCFEVLSRSLLIPAVLCNNVSQGPGGHCLWQLKMWFI